jgi:dimethylhistidine N-methyltransferase
MTIRFYDLHPPEIDFYAEVCRGFRQPQKSISPKFLYDKQGSELFEAICDLQEYYLTRSEISILRSQAGEISSLLADGVLIEFGCGSCQKVPILLDATPNLQAYVALDISKDHLRESCDQLASRYPDLDIIAICTDYNQPIHLPDELNLHHRHKVGFFPGSSIGNLEPIEVITFLQRSASLLQPHGGFLIGVDLKKDTAILEPAYDDPQGISAAFALNLLHRINQELQANFDVNQFRYRSVYNPMGRIEMGLESLSDQQVTVADQVFQFQQGEILHTENSYKYTVSEFQSLARAAGFESKCVWTDPDNYFSLHYLYLI